MVEREEKQTVIVDRDEPRTSGAWVGVLIAIIIIILLFLLFGGMNMFRGGSTNAPSVGPGSGSSGVQVPTGNQ